MNGNKNVKKVLKLFATLFIGITLVGCSQKTSEQKSVELPHIPEQLYAINEITPASMAELEAKMEAWCPFCHVAAYNSWIYRIQYIPKLGRAGPVR